MHGRNHGNGKRTYSSVGADRGAVGDGHLTAGGFVRNNKYPQPAGIV